MPTTKKRIDMFNSEEGTRIRKALEKLEQDITYKTEISSYTADGTTHPDHQISFVDKHLTYLNKHNEVNPDHYLSNLRLMLRIRR